MNTARPHVWLTSRRIRVHGLLLAIAAWSIYLWTLSTPHLRDRNGLVKGTDFVHFYTLGTLALEHRGVDLYNMFAQSDLIAQKLPEAGRLLFVPLYGPQVSLLFAPLAKVPYAWALALWWIASAAIYSACCYAVWKTCPHLRPHWLTVLILAIAFPPFLHLIAWGQTSALALACFTAAYLALRSERFFLAGLAFGCLAFKPQLGIVAGLLFLLTWNWKVIAGAFVSAAAQLSTGWIYYGTPVMRDYVHHLVRVQAVYSLFEPRPYQMHSLRSFWAMLIPWPQPAFALYLLTAAAVLAITFRFWKSAATLELRYSVLLLATVLVSPHLTVYDLLILAPAFLLLADAAVAAAKDRDDPTTRTLGLLLYFCFALPLLGPLAQWTHVQLSVPAMVLLMLSIVRLSLVSTADAPHSV